jgi:hypothetical protein
MPPCIPGCAWPGACGAWPVPGPWLLGACGAGASPAFGRLVARGATRWRDRRPCGRSGEPGRLREIRDPHRAAWLISRSGWTSASTWLAQSANPRFFRRALATRATSWQMPPSRPRVFRRTVRRQPRRNNRAGDGPHPRPVLRRAAAAKDAADGALAVQHIVIVGSAGAGAAGASGRRTSGILQSLPQDATPLAGRVVRWWRGGSFKRAGVRERTVKPGASRPRMSSLAASIS